MKSKIELTIREYTYVYDAANTKTLYVYKDSSYPFLEFNPLSFRVNGKCMAPWGEDITLEQFKEIAHKISEFIPILEDLVIETLKKGDK